MTGRPPKSMELHALEGTRSEVGTRKGGKRIAPRKTQKITVGGRRVLTLEPPADLDDAAKAAWSELLAQVTSVLDEADAAMLEVAAVALGRFRMARRLVNLNGLLIEGRFGLPVENPALKIERDAGSMLHRACIELGIGPSARARFSGVGIEGMPASEAINGVADLVAIRGGRA